MTAVIGLSLVDQLVELRPPCEVHIRRLPGDAWRLVDRCPQCRRGWRHCGQPAAWIVRTACACGHRYVDLFCAEDCRSTLDRAPGFVFECSACGRVDQVLDVTAERL